MPSPVSQPSSQKSGDRPISFVLVDQTDSTGAISPSTALTLYIRPEDLTRTDSSRLSPQQTLGNFAWADNFGPGIPTISISGHTGWRAPADPAAGTDDGVARFLKLKNQIFTNWHARRLVAIQNGKDPDQSVQLQFADQLDSIAAVVAPLSFVLRRSRTRPLLMQYQITMIVLNDNIAQPIIPRLTTPGQAQQSAAGATSLANSNNTILGMVSTIQNYVDASIATGMKAFLTQSTTVFSSVLTGLNTVNGVTASVINLATLVAAAGITMFRTLASMANTVYQTKVQLMIAAGAFSNALCVLKNVFAQPIFFENYSSLLGSSNCSSTNGGAPPTPFIGLNPFQFTNPQQVIDPVTVTPIAQSSMQTMASYDTVRSPPTLAAIGNTATVASAGIVSH